MDELNELFDDCSIDELQRIMDLDFEIGYDQDFLKDKIDFFNKLPPQQKA